MINIFVFAFFHFPEVTTVAAYLKSRSVLRAALGFLSLLNPIPTGHGLNQPIYRYRVTQAGRNRAW